MSAFERLLVPGSTERPTCRCGDVMEVVSIERLPEGSDAAAAHSVKPIAGIDLFYDIGVPIVLIWYWVTFFSFSGMLVV